MMKKSPFRCELSMPVRPGRDGLLFTVELQLNTHTHRKPIGRSLMDYTKMYPAATGGHQYIGGTATFANPDDVDGAAEFTPMKLEDGFAVLNISENAARLYYGSEAGAVVIERAEDKLRFTAGSLADVANLYNDPAAIQAFEEIAAELSALTVEDTGVRYQLVDVTIQNEALSTCMTNLCAEDIVGVQRFIGALTSEYCELHATRHPQHSGKVGEYNVAKTEAGIWGVPRTSFDYILQMAMGGRDYFRQPLGQVPAGRHATSRRTAVIDIPGRAKSVMERLLGRHTGLSDTALGMA